jgi:hypothetical protein
VGGNTAEKTHPAPSGPVIFTEEDFMKRYFIPTILALVLFGLQALDSPAVANQRRRHPRRRAVVVVHKGFPLHRPLRHVVVRPILHPYRVAPRVFLPLIVWEGTVVATLPGSDVLVWEDGETLVQEEDWTEFTLNCQNTGTRLWLEIVSGRAQFDWAEIVFGNGEAQVVEMKEFVRGQGFYPLLDFADGRMVDHVRVIARADTPEARVVLKMQK